MRLWPFRISVVTGTLKNAISTIEFLEGKVDRLNECVVSLSRNINGKIERISELEGDRTRNEPLAALRTVEEFILPQGAPLPDAKLDDGLANAIRLIRHQVAIRMTR